MGGKWTLAAEGDQRCAYGDQSDPSGGHCREAFSEEDHPEDRDQHDAKFIDWSHFCSFANLQRTEVADPRCTSSKPGKHEERHGPAA